MRETESHAGDKARGLSDLYISRRFGRGRSICARSVASCYSCIKVGMRPQFRVDLELRALSSPRGRGGDSATFSAREGGLVRLGDTQNSLLDVSAGTSGRVETEVQKGSTQGHKCAGRVKFFGSDLGDWPSRNPPDWPTSIPRKSLQKYSGRLMERR